MPELPEVETIARKLRPALVGRTILSANLRWSRALAAPSPKKFAQQIKGQKILDVGRRAKYFILPLSSFTLLIHLRMSGDLHIKPSTNQPGKHDRLIIKLSGNKSLTFNDTRKFGRVWLLADPAEILGKLGPEPLGKDFTPQWLYAALQRRRRQLKPLLLDPFLSELSEVEIIMEINWSIAGWIVAVLVFYTIGFYEGRSTGADAFWQGALSESNDEPLCFRRYTEIPWIVRELDDVSARQVLPLSTGCAWVVTGRPTGSRRPSSAPLPLNPGRTRPCVPTTAT
jgi:hypothetical protein